VVAVGAIDHGVGGAGFGGQQFGVVQGADHRLDPVGADTFGLRWIAHQAAYLMAQTGQTGGDRAADI
jgi:hypothetical protein